MNDLITPTGEEFTPIKDDEEQECGYSYDHDVETTYEGEDGWQGLCRACGAELWDGVPR